MNFVIATVKKHTKKTNLKQLLMEENERIIELQKQLIKSQEELLDYYKEMFAKKDELLTRAIYIIKSLNLNPPENENV